MTEILTTAMLIDAIDTAVREAHLTRAEAFWLESYVGKLERGDNMPALEALIDNPAEFAIEFIGARDEDADRDRQADAEDHRHE